jgi:hypothetical protein
LSASSYASFIWHPLQQAAGSASYHAQRDELAAGAFSKWKKSAISEADREVGWASLASLQHNNRELTAINSEFR